MRPNTRSHGVIRSRLTSQGLAALAVPLFAFGLRTVGLAGRALWYDEAFAMLYAALSYPRMLYGTVSPVEGAGAADVHPLAYYVLLHNWMQAVGRTPFAVRYLSVCLGVVTVALVWHMAHRLFDRRSGLAAGLLVATNPFHVAYSREARMYALLGLAVVAATYGMLRAFDSSRSGKRAWPWWGVYVASASLTLYAHNLGALFLLVLNVQCVLRPDWRKRTVLLIIANAIVFTLSAPWMIGVLPGQLGFVRRGYWVARPGGAELLRSLMLLTLTYYEPAPLWVLGLGLFAGLLSLVLLALRLLRRRSPVARFTMLVWAPVLLLFSVAQRWPVYLERALLPAALFYCIVAGWLVAGAGLPRVMRWTLVLPLAVGAVGSLWTHYTYAAFPRPPFPRAAAYLESRLEPGDVVVHTNKLTYFPMAVYAPHLPAVFLADEPGSPQDTLARPTQVALGLYARPDMASCVVDEGRVWLVYFDREVDQRGAAHPGLVWLTRDFAPIEEMVFNDLQVVLLQRQDG
ncbi:MAG: hypothetical protein GX620_09595 [Chloroflexi bacterium]|nr:hypothetical protein [Chloroflexota bacterium]